MMEPQILRGRAILLFENIIKQNETSITNQVDKGGKRNISKLSTRRNALKTESAASRPSLTTEAGPVELKDAKQQDVQTDLFLEEIAEFDRKKTAAFQTEEADFENEVGVDLVVKVEKTNSGTQIDPDLVFDFDEEIMPILENLIGKALDESAKEIMQEDEEEAVMKQQQDFATKMLYHERQLGKLKAAEKRKADEIRRQRRQTEVVTKQNSIAFEKRVARECASNFLKPLKQGCLEKLQRFGWFKCPAKIALETYFMPSFIDDGLLKAQKSYNAAREAFEDAIVSTSEDCDTSLKINNFVTIP